jgi:hypothetical protein
MSVRDLIAATSADPKRLAKSSRFDLYLNWSAQQGKS